MTLNDLSRRVAGMNRASDSIRKVPHEYLQFGILRTPSEQVVVGMILTTQKSPATCLAYQSRQ